MDPNRNTAVVNNDKNVNAASNPSAINPGVAFISSAGMTTFPTSQVAAASLPYAYQPFYSLPQQQQAQHQQQHQHQQAKLTNSPTQQANQSQNNVAINLPLPTQTTTWPFAWNYGSFFDTANKQSSLQQSGMTTAQMAAGQVNPVVAATNMGQPGTTTFPNVGGMAGTTTATAVETKAGVISVPLKLPPLPPKARGPLPATNDNTTNPTHQFVSQQTQQIEPFHSLLLQQQQQRARARSGPVDNVVRRRPATISLTLQRKHLQQIPPDARAVSVTTLPRRCTGSLQDQVVKDKVSCRVQPERVSALRDSVPPALRLSCECFASVSYCNDECWSLALDNRPGSKKRTARVVEALNQDPDAFRRRDMHLAKKQRAEVASRASSNVVHQTRVRARSSKLNFQGQNAASPERGAVVEDPADLVRRKQLTAPLPPTYYTTPAKDVNGVVIDGLAFASCHPSQVRHNPPPPVQNLVEEQALKESAPMETDENGDGYTFVNALVAEFVKGKPAERRKEIEASVMKDMEAVNAKIEMATVNVKSEFVADDLRRQTGPDEEPEEAKTPNDPVDDDDDDDEYKCTDTLDDLKGNKETDRDKIMEVAQDVALFQASAVILRRMARDLCARRLKLKPQVAA